MNNTLTLIRGIPGSGKTTIAKIMYPYHILVEADQFFTNGNGDYHYNPGMIKAAHAWCRSRTRSLLTAGHNVVVANTFIKRWEMQPYFELAKTLNISVPVTVTATGTYKNTHNVPQHVIDRMKEGFEL